MSKSISDKESDALNLIRWLSTISIVVCHIFQAHNNISAWIFNIGVQVFFILSGFIYGRRRIKNVKQFFIGRIIKLYIPYLLWVLVAMIILYVFAPRFLTLSSVIGQIFMRSNVPGLEHLWFMPVIFFCYLLLPLIDKGMNRNPIVSTLCLICFFGTVLVLRQDDRIIWIILYFVGYYCGRYPRLIYPFLTLSILMTLYIMNLGSWNIEIFRQSGVYATLLHASGGLLIFLQIYAVISSVQINVVISRLLTNRGGYEVYLVHHLFFIGPLSLLFISSYKWLNIVIALSIVIIASILLTACSTTIIKKLLNTININS